VSIKSGELHPSPFDRIIALDWHDGLKAGLAACTASKRAYSIDFRSWDVDEVRRVYALSSIDFEDFERVLGLMSSLGPPRWPMWFPIWRFHSPAAREATECALAKLRDELQQPAFVVLAEDLSREIMRSAALGDPVVRERFARLEATKAPFEAWEAFIHENGNSGGNLLCE